MTAGNVGAHYVMPTLREIDPTYLKDEIIVYNLVNENERAWHAGVSSWSDKTSLNDISIGIEMVNKSTDIEFIPYPDEQIKIIIQLCQNILARYPDIAPTHVLGHSDIAVGRKKDPGPLFPWKTLYKSGIGAWYDADTVNAYTQKFIQEMPSTADVIKKLSDCGHNVQVDEKALFTAF